MCDIQYEMRNKWKNQFIQRQFKNKHRPSRFSRKKPRVRCSNSLKQDRKENSPVHKRLIDKKINYIYCKINVLHDDNYNSMMDEFIPVWQCLRCSYINIEQLSYCAICDFCYYSNNDYLKKPSLIFENPSLPLIFKSSLIQKKKKNKKKNQFKLRINDAFAEYDHGLKQYKKFMKKRNASIIEFKPNSNQIQKANDKKNKENSLEISKLYSNVYLNKNLDDINIELIINTMIKFIPEKHAENYEILNDDNDNDNDHDMDDNKEPQICQVCYMEYNNLISMKKYCNHCMICHHCFVQYLSLKIKENDIMPWILCPAENCKAPIDSNLILNNILNKNILIQFAQNFLYKHLVRFDKKYWIECSNNNCKFGWNWNDIEQNGKKMNNVIILKCNNCNNGHEIKLTENKKKDDGFNELFANGLLRKCPKCSFPAMKDRGMCNVMHCGKCGIFWNWRTKQFGTSSAQVKQQARNSGSLWEPGELDYQLQLERNNLPEFIKLLNRNGIKYDPNYRRGS